MNLTAHGDSRLIKEVVFLSHSFLQIKKLLHPHQVLLIVNKILQAFKVFQPSLLSHFFLQDLNLDFANFTFVTYRVYQLSCLLLTLSDRFYTTFCELIQSFDFKAILLLQGVVLFHHFEDCVYFVY